MVFERGVCPKSFIKMLFSSDAYEKYMMSETDSYENDVDLIVSLFKNAIAPNEKIYEYFEDDKLTWVDDIPIVEYFFGETFKKGDPQQ